MKIVVVTYYNVGVAILRELLKKGEKIAAVVAWPEKEPLPLEYSVIKTAFQNYLPLYCPKNINSPAFIQILKDLKPDLILSAYYPKLFCKEILDIPKLGCVNIHDSLLPRYRGQTPLNWAIANGDKQTGLTMHYLAPGMDNGDIISQEKIDISPEDTVFTLNEKLAPLAAKLVRENLDLIKEGKAPRIQQEEEKATYVRQWKPEDGLIDWNKSSWEIHNLIRAATRPYSGAFTFLNKKKILIWASQLTDTQKFDNKKLLPGEILALNGKGLLVNTGDGKIVITEMEFAEGGEVFDYLKKLTFLSRIILG